MRGPRRSESGGPCRVGADRLPTPEQPVRLKPSSLPWFWLEQERVVGADLVGRFENRCLQLKRNQPVWPGTPVTAAPRSYRTPRTLAPAPGSARPRRPDLRWGRRRRNGPIVDTPEFERAIPESW